MPQFLGPAPSSLLSRRAVDDAQGLRYMTGVGTRLSSVSATSLRLKNRPRQQERRRGQRPSRSTTPNCCNGESDALLATSLLVLQKRLKLPGNLNKSCLHEAP